MSIEHTFSKPVNFEGQEIKSIKMDLDSLTGRDISQVKSQWAHAGNFSPVPAADTDFCVMVAARASKQPLELFDVMPAKEYLGITQKVSNFLMG